MSAKRRDDVQKAASTAGRTAKKPAATASPRRRPARRRKPAAERTRRPKRQEPTSDAPASPDEMELGIGSRVLPPDTNYGMEYDATAFPQSADHDLDVEAQIRALEARLDGLIRGGTPEPTAPSLREQIGSAAQKVVGRLNVPVELPGADGGAAEAMRELMSSDYYVRQWGRIGMRHRSEDVDDFGLDPIYEARLRPLLDFLYRRWFRVDTDGIEHIPSQGRCIVVANHSGTLPLDGVMLRTAVRLDHPARRELRWLEIGRAHV